MIALTSYPIATTEPFGLSFLQDMLTEGQASPSTILKANIPGSSSETGKWYREGNYFVPISVGADLAGMEFTGTFAQVRIVTKATLYTGWLTVWEKIAGVWVEIAELTNNVGQVSALSKKSGVYCSWSLPAPITKWDNTAQEGVMLNFEFWVDFGGVDATHQIRILDKSNREADSGVQWLFPSPILEIGLITGATGQVTRKKTHVHYDMMSPVADEMVPFPISDSWPYLSNVGSYNGVPSDFMDVGAHKMGGSTSIMEGQTAIAEWISGGEVWAIAGANDIFIYDREIGSLKRRDTVANYAAKCSSQYLVNTANVYAVGMTIGGSYLSLLMYDHITYPTRFIWAMFNISDGTLLREVDLAPGSYVRIKYNAANQLYYIQTNLSPYVVQKYNVNQVYQSSTPLPTQDVSDFTWNSAGDLYVISQFGRQIHSIDSVGNIMKTYGDAGENVVGGLAFPKGIAIDANDRIYALDQGTLQCWKPTGFLAPGQLATEDQIEYVVGNEDGTSNIFVDNWGAQSVMIDSADTIWVASGSPWAGHKKAKFYGDVETAQANAIKKTRVTSFKSYGRTGVSSVGLDKASNDEMYHSDNALCAPSDLIVDATNIHVLDGRGRIFKMVRSTGKLVGTVVEAPTPANNASEITLGFVPYPRTLNVVRTRNAVAKTLELGLTGGVYQYSSVIGGTTGDYVPKVWGNNFPGGAPFPKLDNLLTLKPSLKVISASKPSSCSQVYFDRAETFDDTITVGYVGVHDGDKLLSASSVGNGSKTTCCYYQKHSTDGSRVGYCHKLSKGVCPTSGVSSAAGVAGWEGCMFGVGIRPGIPSSFLGQTMVIGVPTGFSTGDTVVIEANNGKALTGDTWSIEYVKDVSDNGEILLDNGIVSSNDTLSRFSKKFANLGGDYYVLFPKHDPVWDLVTALPIAALHGQSTITPTIFRDANYVYIRPFVAASQGDVTKLYRIAVSGGTVTEFTLPADAGYFLGVWGTKLVFSRWVASVGSIYTFDTSNAAWTAVISTGGTYYYNGVIVGNNLYVYNTVIDLSAGTQSGTGTGGKIPICTDGTRIYCTLVESGLTNGYVFTIASSTSVKVINGIAGESEPWASSVGHIEGSYLYAAKRFDYNYRRGPSTSVNDSYVIRRYAISNGAVSEMRLPTGTWKHIVPYSGASLMWFGKMGNRNNKATLYTIPISSIPVYTGAVDFTTFKARVEIWDEATKGYVSGFPAATVGCAVDIAVVTRAATNYIWVLDQTNKNIKEYTTGGVLQNTYDVVDKPYAIAVSSSEIFVGKDNKISVYNTSGILARTITAGADMLRNIKHMSFDDNNRLVVVAHQAVIHYALNETVDYIVMEGADSPYTPMRLRAATLYGGNLYEVFSRGGKKALEQDYIASSSLV